MAYAPGIPNRILSARVSDAGPGRPGRVQELKFDERDARLEAHVVLEWALAGLRGGAVSALLLELPDALQVCTQDLGWSWASSSGGGAAGSTRCARATGPSSRNSTRS